MVHRRLSLPSPFLLWNATSDAHRKVCLEHPQNGGGKHPRERRWRWTPTTTGAFKLYLRGHAPIGISRRLGVHRNTLTRWMAAREWVAAVMRTVLKGDARLM